MTASASDPARLPLSRRQLIGTVPAAAIAGSAVAAPAASASPPEAAGPHRLWYRAPATEWTEALPVGNGRIGAMLFGGVASERLQLNEDTLWAGGPYDPVNPQALRHLPELRAMIDAGRFAEAEKFANAHVMATPLRQAAYQTVGSLMLGFPDLEGRTADGYHRELDLDAAVAETRFSVDGVRHVRRVLASPVDQLIAVHLAASSAGRIHVRLGFSCPLKQWRVAADGPRTLVLSGRNDPHGSIAGALIWEARLDVATRGGTVRVDGDQLVIEGADDATIRIAIATSYRSYTDVSGDPAAITRAQLARAPRDFARIARAATAEHRRLYRRVHVDFGTTPAALLPTDQRIRQSETVDDPALAALYFHYGRYLLICSSRPGSQPANLQGIWNDKTSPPWGSKYTININTEMNYWPAQPTQLPECVEPLIRLVREIAETGAITARTMYGARGWVCHHNTDLWRATAPIDGAKFGLWPMGGAWLCTHLYEHYEYKPDRGYLASIYPILKGAALFFLDTLQEDPATGHLVTNPSLSPELGHGRGSSLVAGPAMDSQILTDLFGQTAAAAATLGQDAAFAEQCLAAQRRLPPMKVGAEGQLQEWREDWDMTADDLQHRHVSHLYALHPSFQITPEHTPELARAAARSLDIRGDMATGWAIAWRINLWARLNDGNRAHRILRLLLGPERTYPNMLDAHPPFQIDGNFGGTAAMVEMLVRNHKDSIHLLPALPDAWPAGSAHGLRTRGGCIVDLAWADGALMHAKLRAPARLVRRVRLGAAERTVTLAPGRPLRLTPRSFA